MARRKNWSAEQIVAKLRQIEIQMAQGRSLALACKEAEISEQELQDECLKLEIFYSLRQAQVVIAAWKDHHNHVRPHSSLGYRPPAPVTLQAIVQQLSTTAAMQCLTELGPKSRSGQQSAAVSPHALVPSISTMHEDWP
jgi:putative transposase